MQVNPVGHVRDCEMSSLLQFLLKVDARINSALQRICVVLLRNNSLFAHRYFNYTDYVFFFAQEDNLWNWEH